MLATGKAFPEAEAVLRFSHRPKDGEEEAALEIVYENRLGARFQYEIEATLRLDAPAGEGTGAGDLKLGAKRALHFDLRRKEILSGGLGFTLPTGSESKRLSSGTVIATPFLAYSRHPRRAPVILPEVSVLLSAFRSDAAEHAAYHRWLEGVVNGRGSPPSRSSRGASGSPPIGTLHVPRGSGGGRHSEVVEVRRGNRDLTIAAQTHRVGA